MANMIIKPAADGNLLIQDRAGSAVLSTAASGATVANATLTTPTIANMANCTFPAGHIIQVKFTSINSAVSTSSSSYVNTGMSLAITPSSASNKIYILGSHVLRAPSSNYQHNVKRDSTFLAPTEFRGFTQFRDASGNNSDSTQAFMFLDSQTTTSSVTYSVWHKSEAGNIAYFVHR